MEKVQIAGAAVLPVDGCVMGIDYGERKGRAWLAPVGRENDRTRIPARLIGPRFVPGMPLLAGPNILQIFLEMPLTITLLIDGVVSEHLRELIEVIESPDVVLTIGPNCNAG